MTDRERLIELIEKMPWKIVQDHLGCRMNNAELADYLLANGVIVAPMPMADWLRKELTEYVYQRCMYEL